MDTTEETKSKIKILHDEMFNIHKINQSELYDALKNSDIFDESDKINDNIPVILVATSETEENDQQNLHSHYIIQSALLVITVLLTIILINPSFTWLLGVRCFIPNNYLIWEAMRPISDCEYCKGISKPLILQNMTRDEFLPFAYSQQPIIMKNAVTHWPARTTLNFAYLKNMYQKHYRNSLKTFQDECQFLNFKSNFLTLEHFFEMSEERARTGQPAWYVGFSNCQADVLNELRTLYPIPHFLPSNAEIPNTDYIFLGYDQGAIMHLDYIPRLMWQAQLLGNKSWNLAPTPECENVCEKFSFYVEPGDAVLIDTRIWFHGTNILNGEFSLTIQSEYG